MPAEGRDGGRGLGAAGVSRTCVRGGGMAAEGMVVRWWEGKLEVGRGMRDEGWGLFTYPFLVWGILRVGEGVGEN